MHHERRLQGTDAAREQAVDGDLETRQRARDEDDQGDHDERIHALRLAVHNQKIASMAENLCKASSRDQKAAQDHYYRSSDLGNYCIPPSPLP
jgi:hypothetical protein